MQSHGRRMQITVLPENRIVEASHGESLLDCLLRNKIPLDHSCGGFGTCGTCRVLVLSGIENLEPRNEIEQEMAQDRGFQQQERLSCQTVVCTDLVVSRKPSKA